MNGRFLPDGAFRSEICFSDSDTDRFGRVESSAVLWQMQEAAGAHYEALGYGYELIRSHGCFWAVIRTELEIPLPPVPGETLLLDTWCGRTAHGLYRRHYLLLRDDETVLVRGVSVWVLMDQETRQLSSKRSWLPDPVPVIREGELSPSRREPFPESVGTAERIVLGSEIDRNGHLNNSLYLRWASDLLPESFAGDHVLSSLRIEYKKELTVGQSVELSYTLEDRTLYLTGAVEGRESFFARCTYDPI